MCTVPDRSHSDGALIDAVARRLRRPLDLGPDVDARVLREIRSSRHAPDAVWSGRLWSWLRRPRSISFSPLQAIGVAAALLVVALGGSRLARVAPPALPQEVRFTLTMPGSSNVALVGDFNDWDPTATPLAPTGPGLWTVTVPLEPGR